MPNNIYEELGLRRRRPTYQPYEPVVPASSEPTMRGRFVEQILPTQPEAMPRPTSITQKREDIEVRKLQSYYLIVEDKNGRITSSTIRPEKLQQEQITLEHERREGKIKSYYITQNPREANQLQQRIQVQQRKEAQRLKSKVRYPGREKYREETKKGIEKFKKEITKPKPRTERFYEPTFPEQELPRQNFWSYQSPNYQETSKFSSRYIAPYRPLSAGQVFLKVKPFNPQPVRTSFSPPQLKIKFFNPFKPRD